MMVWVPTKAAHLIILALKEVGKPYILGSEGPVGTSLKTWDCSELVQHLLAMVGIIEILDSLGRKTRIDRFDGAGNQWNASRSISLPEGVGTTAALLFVQSGAAYRQKPYNIGHVAISLGDGYIIEARGKAYGVTIGPVRKSFNLATKINELYLPA